MSNEIKLPTYEDGTTVQFGDLIENKKNISFCVKEIILNERRAILIGKNAKEEGCTLYLENGEHAW